MILEQPLDVKYFKDICLESGSDEEIVRKLNTYYQIQFDNQFDKYANIIEKIISQSPN